MSVENLRRVLDQADAIDYREGKISYFRYRRLMKRIAMHYGRKVEQVTAGFCSLSPNNGYVGNLRSLVSVLEGLHQGVDQRLIVVSTYRGCRDRAIKFIKGEIDFVEYYADRRTGKKILSFFRNITNPLDPEPVTVDGHAYSIWLGERMTMKQAVRERFTYEEIAEGYRKLAGDVGLLPNQLQAILWFTWKRIHNVLWQPQLNLLRPSDNWGLLLEPKEITPFPFFEVSQGMLPLCSSGSQMPLWR